MTDSGGVCYIEIECCDFFFFFLNLLFYVVYDLSASVGKRADLSPGGDVKIAEDNI